MSQTKTCKTCGFLDRKQNGCPLLRMVVDPDKDYCSKHSDAMEVCEACGNYAAHVNYAPDGDKWHILCDSCASKLNSCAFCQNMKDCRFETDPSPTPPYVQQKIRQGPITTVATVKNPERIRQTCEKGCHCFDAEFGCMRQFHYCKEMNHIYADPS